MFTFYCIYFCWLRSQRILEFSYQYSSFYNLYNIWHITEKFTLITKITAFVFFHPIQYYAKTIGKIPLLGPSTEHMIYIIDQDMTQIYHVCFRGG